MRKDRGLGLGFSHLLLIIDVKIISIPNFKREIPIARHIERLPNVSGVIVVIDLCVEMEAECSSAVIVS